MARILGLDIGSYSVKALLLDSTFRGYTVKSFAEAKVTPEGGVKGALASLAANKYLAADQVVVAVPGAAVATHVLTLPFTDPRRIESTLGFEVEGQLPYDLSEVTYDYQPLATREEGKAELLVGVVRNEELANLLAMLDEVGADPRLITTSAIAYQNVLTTAALGEPGPAPLEGSIAIVDIGHERTSIAIGDAKTGLEHARTFLGGGKDLTRVVASDFKVSPADAEAWKENEGDVTLGEGISPEQEKAAGALLRGLAPIVREIRATFRGHQAKFRRPVARVYLTGGTAKLRGLPALLTRELGAEVVLLQALPREAVSALPPGAEATGAQAFALALRAHANARNVRFNLRRGTFEFKGDLDYIKGKAGRLSAMAAVLVALAIALVWSQLHALTVREESLDSSLCTTTQRVVGQCVKDYMIALSMLRGKGSPAATIPAYSAVDILAEITQRTQGQKVKFGEMEINLERVRLRGETDSFDAVDQVVGALKNFRCFQEIKRGRVQRSRDGSKVEFDLDINVQCGGEAKAEG